jgi:hypothetical protein
LFFIFPHKNATACQISKYTASNLLSADHNGLLLLFF